METNRMNNRTVNHRGPNSQHPQRPVYPPVQVMVDPWGLGDCKSLAMAYVLWQQWREVYSCEKALENGTLFPDLNKPFLGGRCS